jgi:hypothetical protein
VKWLWFARGRVEIHPRPGGDSPTGRLWFAPGCGEDSPQQRNFLANYQWSFTRAQVEIRPGAGEVSPGRGLRFAHQIVEFRPALYARCLGAPCTSRLPRCLRFLLDSHRFNTVGGRGDPPTIPVIKSQRVRA